MLTAKPSYHVVLLPGDGIGVEVTADARALLEALGPRLGVGFALDEIPCGGLYYQQHGRRDWPEGAEQRCHDADVVLLGAVGWNGPDGQPVTMSNGKMAGWSPVIGNRVRLGLYANVRPIRLLKGVKHGLSGRFAQVWEPGMVDMIMVRENTEGLYSGIGGVAGDAAIDTRVITRAASRRVIRKAFELSRGRGTGAPVDGKKRVTCVVKHNVLHGCKLFAEVFHEVGKDFPDIEKDVAIVDSFAMFLLTRPEHYDVVVTTNMFGDILTDLGSVLQGGMGMAVGCNVGDDHAMFEPIHGSAPPLAGRDLANPLAMLLATAEALLWLGRRRGDERLIKGGRAIDDAVAAIIARGKPLTTDLVGAERGAPRSVVAAAVRDEALARLA
ncbi:MAG: isocitrate/isopropylmalate dehydrogenase family protein [Kofleriaceae bacterium]|nr:isocitrate/isopropylmalate dehydrogenase family protein [Kofleriaceae bacterium]MCL4225360.1 isocitrate/isopropylmalate dehydrogenase family protein [Myxococcales bacterium]